jgi:hypothetical protein
VDTRHVTVDIRKPDKAKLWSGTVRMAMDAIDGEGQQALLDHGFAVREESAVLEVVGEDEEKVNQALMELKQWIDAWATRQGIRLAFTWRVRRYTGL